MNTNLNNKRILPHGVALSLPKWKMSAGQMGKTLLCLGLIFTLNQSIAQTNLTNSELNNLVFGNIVEECNSPFLLNFSNVQSNLFGFNDSLNNQKKQTGNDWLLAYNDLMNSYTQENNPYLKIGDYYINIDKNRNNTEGDVIQLPLGIIYQNYNYVNVPENINNGNLSVDGNEQTLNMEVSSDLIIEEDSIFTANIIADSLYIYETLRVLLADEYNISKESIQSVRIYREKTYLGELYNDGYLDINLIAGDNEFNIIYTNTNGIDISSNFTVFGKILTETRASGDNPFSILNITNTPSESIITADMDGNDQGAKIKIFYGCNNTEQKILKPFITIMGYSPANILNFNLLIDKYNSNDLLTRLHNRNYDVIIVKFDYGADRVENMALLTKAILKEVNARKFANGSYVENNLVGYSSGALAGRMALMMMEKDYQANPVVENLHHSRLLISYDGEHQGANVPLAAQHSVISIIENPQSYLPSLGILAVLDQYTLISSPQAKDFMIYHHSQTGDANSPGQGAHPNYYDTRSKYITSAPYGTGYYYQPNTNKVGEYPTVRNIAIADGASQPVYHPIGLLGYNATVLKIDKHTGIDFFGWDRHNYMEWRAVNGGGHMVFKRIYEKKTTFSSNYTVLIDEEKHTNNNALFIDGAQGSNQNLYNSVKDATKATFLTNNPEVDFSSTMCFLPTASALDLFTGFTTYDYDLRADNLMWEDPDASPQFAQLNNIGYPSIPYGPGTGGANAAYTHTPFDAIYAPLDSNLNHGAAAEASILAPLMTDFLISEVHYDTIWLQFLDVGIWSSTSQNYGYYPVKFEAINSISCGTDVTFKTQHLPLVLNPNSDVEMKAGDYISFMPGTTIKVGAKLHAYIESTEECSGIKSSQQNTNYQSEAYYNSQKIVEPQITTIKEFVKNTPHLIVYPNPSYGIFTVTNPFLTDVRYQIYALNGSLLFNGILKNGVNNLTLDLTKGIYFIKVTNQTQVLTSKIIIQ